MAKFINTTWKVFTYDVWGNAKDGYEVNQTFASHEVTLRLTVRKYNEGTPQEFESASPSDKQLRQALDCMPRIKLDVNGDDTIIYVNHASSDYPLGELHCVSHESLSPIRKKEPKPEPKL